MSVIIENARKILRREFDDDEDFRQTYISNVAMLLHDKYGIVNYEDRNNAAEDIMKLIFG